MPPEFVHRFVPDVTSVFVAAGQQDQIVPSAQTAQLVGLRGGAGANVTVHVECAGHPRPDGDVAGARAWRAPHLALLA